MDTNGELDPESVVGRYEALLNGDFSKVDVVVEDASVRDPVAPDGVSTGATRSRTTSARRSGGSPTSRSG